MREGIRQHLISQLAQLEDVGFVPIVPFGGPRDAARFERVGLVHASQLSEPLAWTTHAGEQMHGYAGDWRVIDDAGNMRTVTDPDFQASHEPEGDGRWRRVGTYLAWRVQQAVVIRTKEGKATAQPGDWVVEAPTGERWPVEHDQFKWSYQPVPNQETASPDTASPETAQAANPQDWPEPPDQTTTPAAPASA
jgi:hypothetical protein